MNNSKKTENNVENDTTTFDNAIRLTGYGKFHFELVVLCAVCILSVGFQNGLSSYVFPAAMCELGLGSSDIGNLNVSFLIGGIVSSFIWGVLADLSGRKKVIMWAHLVNFAITVVCAINPYYAMLMICRFLNGFLIGAPGSIIFSYLAEFQPPKLRGAVVCYCGLFFTMAWLVLPVTAFMVLPLSVNIQMDGLFILNSWRIFLIILVIPELIVGIWILRLPESPKFHMSKGNNKVTLEILRQMYAKNTGKSEDLYPVKNLINENKPEANNKVGVDGKSSRLLKKILIGIKGLFQGPLLPITLLTCAIMFSNMFGVFGLGLWLPEFFNRFQKFQEMFPNRTATIKDLALLKPNSAVSCSPSFDNSVIMNTVAMAIVSLIYNGVSGWLTSKVDMKIVPLVSMLLGGFSSLSIYWLTSSTQNLIVSCIFQASMVTANMTIGSVVVELFPTSVGALAICLIMCAGRIGAMLSNMFFGYFMDDHCEIPIFVVAIVVLLGGLLCFLIPKKNDKNDYIGGDSIEISVIANDSS
ncbi:unnamed protein product [Brassicogethes aeneus]|uniref:Major facilitator superfamily (MFS) profile domain-containing protein n=1 Tax=Brassicogethes aeneus TaxID=1431903 RepID=A0A9P0FGH0_BRAAE|nr:unnamed protein product [Brassicogethes aeneus]